MYFKRLERGRFSWPSRDDSPTMALNEEASPEQGTLGLLDEAEKEANARVAEPELATITCRRRKSEGKREEDLSELPVERIEHTLPGDERICPTCGGPMHVMEHDARRELVIVPASLREHPDRRLLGSSAEKVRRGAEVRSP